MGLAILVEPALDDLDTIEIRYKVSCSGAMKKQEILSVKVQAELTYTNPI